MGIAARHQAVGRHHAIAQSNRSRPIVPAGNAGLGWAAGQIGRCRADCLVMQQRNIAILFGAVLLVFVGAIGFVLLRPGPSASPSPSNIAVASPSVSPTRSLSPTVSASASASPSPSPTPSPSPSPSPTASPSPSATPSASPSAAPTAAATASPTPAATAAEFSSPDGYAIT